MLVYDISVENAFSTYDCKWTNGDALFAPFKKHVPYLDVFNIFTQYILVGSWVKVGNILLYEKRLSICSNCILHT